MTRRFDPTLYLVTDPELARGRALIDVVAAAVRGGVTLVQLRDKHAGGRALLETARAHCRAGAARRAADRERPGGRRRGRGRRLPRRPERSAGGRRARDPWAGCDPRRLARGGGGPARGGPRDRRLRRLRAVRGDRDQGRCRPAGRPRWAGRGRQADHVAAGRDRRHRRPQRAEAVRAGADGLAVVSAIMAADDPEAASRALRAAIDAAKAEVEKAL